MINKLKISPDIASLIVRIIIGGIFVCSGWAKIGDMADTLSKFGDMGITAPLTYLVSYGELIGGLMLIIGLWTELAAFFLAIVMIVAVYMTRNFGFLVFAFPLATLAGLIAILGAGAGKYKVKQPHI